MGLNMSDDQNVRSNTTTTASEVVEENMTEYIRYQLVSKFVNVVDGLKLVHRRLIRALGVDTSERNMLDVVTDAMKVHPHGDAPIADALARISQAFSISYPLVSCDDTDGLGNVLKPDEYPAPRYCSVYSGELARDLFLTGIFDRAIPKFTGNTLKEEEPLFYIPKLPVALLYNIRTIGCGISSASIPMDMSNVCDLVSRYIANGNKIDYVKDAELLLPNMPVEVYMMNYDEYMGMVRNPENGGWGILSTSGRLEIVGNILNIHSVGYESNMNTVYANIKSEIKTKNSWLFKELMNYTRGDDKIVLTFRKSTNIHKYLPKLRKMLSLVARTTPNPNYLLPSMRVCELSVQGVLNYWYDARYNSIIVSARFEMDKLKKRKFEQQAIMLVINDIDSVVKIIRSNVDEVAVSKLVEHFKIRYSQAKCIVSLPLSTLGQSSEKKCLETIANIDRRLDEVVADLKDPKAVIMKDLAYFKNKYSKRYPRNLKIDPFIGYVKGLNGGITQFESLDEMFDVISGFNNKVDYVRTYMPTKASVTYARSVAHAHTAPVVPDKIIYPPINSILSPQKDEYAESIVERQYQQNFAVISNTGSAPAKFFKQLPSPRDVPSGNKVVAFGERAICLHRNGDIRTYTRSALFTRKKYVGGHTHEITTAFPANVGKCFLVYMNEKAKNVVRFAYMDPANDRKTPLPQLGKNHYLGIAVVTNEVNVFTLPAECLQRLKLKILVVENIDDAVKNKADFMIELTKSKQPYGTVMKSRRQDGVVHFNTK
jgi:DNA gyrase/topoisomerase IV subunit A